MNRLLVPALASSVALLAWVDVAAAPATAASPHLQQRIDRLLKHRLKPEALPVNPPNPFRLTSGSRPDFRSEDLGTKLAISDAPGPSAAAANESHAREPATAGSSHAEVLIGCATRLKLGGVIILKDQIQIVVNGVPRKEGDMIAADWNNSIVYFRVAQLLPGHMVLRYGDAEATVKF